MIHRLFLDDPAWQTTFPFRVAPASGEWLAGLLLRCDEVNHWGSGTTFTHLLRTSNKSVGQSLNLVLPSGLDLEQLAQALAVPLSQVISTTYQAELARLYDVADPHTTLLTSSFAFCICPKCVAEKRMLTRALTLPHITHCPQHQIALVDTCQCGASLRLFHRQTTPFTCAKCRLDWGKLACLPAHPGRLELEQKLLSYYEFFLTKGTPEVLAAALRLIYDSVVEKRELRVPLFEEETQTSFESRSYQRTTSLGYVVQALLQHDLSFRDILIYAGPLPWRSVRWTTFQCPASNCPYVTMIHEQVRLLNEEDAHLQSE